MALVRALGLRLCLCVRLSLLPFRLFPLFAPLLPRWRSLRLWWRLVVPLRGLWVRFAGGWRRAVTVLVASFPSAAVFRRSAAALPRRSVRVRRWAGRSLAGPARPLALPAWVLLLVWRGGLLLVVLPWGGVLLLVPLGVLFVPLVGGVAVRLLLPVRLFWRRGGARLLPPAVLLVFVVRVVRRGVLPVGGGVLLLLGLARLPAVLAAVRLAPPRCPVSLVGGGCRLPPLAQLMAAVARVVRWAVLLVRASVRVGAFLVRLSVRALPPLLPTTGLPWWGGGCCWTPPALPTLPSVFAPVGGRLLLPLVLLWGLVVVRLAAAMLLWLPPPLLAVCRGGGRLPLPVGLPAAAVLLRRRGILLVGVSVRSVVLVARRVVLFLPPLARLVCVVGGVVRHPLPFLVVRFLAVRRSVGGGLQLLLGLLVRCALVAVRLAAVSLRLALPPHPWT